MDDSANPSPPMTPQPLSVVEKGAEEAVGAEPVVSLFADGIAAIVVELDAPVVIVQSQRENPTPSDVVSESS